MGEKYAQNKIDLSEIFSLMLSSFLSRLDPHVLSVLRTRLSSRVHVEKGKKTPGVFIRWHIFYKF